MRLSASCLVVFGFLVAMPTISQSQLGEERFVNLLENSPLNNLEILHDGNVIVGSKGRIFLFNGSLAEVRHYNTCEPDTCDNINKVMIVNDNELVICGTGEKGRCEVLGLPEFQVLIGANDSATAISTDRDRPAIAGIHEDGTVMFAVTNGPGASAGNIYHNPSSSYAISKRRLKDLSALSNIKFKEDFLNFTIYYKDVFQHANYSYFVTNQDKTGKKSSREMISKVARVCSHDEHELKGYVDFEIGYQYHELEYNLIQHVTKLETSDGKVWIIGVFTRGEDPEKLSGNSAVCAATLTDVDNAINETWDDFVACNDTLTTEERYLTDNRQRPCNSSSLIDRDYKLCINHEPSMSYNIGLRKLKMTFSSWVGNNLVSAVNLAYLSNGKYPVLLLGTLSGKLIMMNIKSDGDTLDISRYFEYSLNNGVPVTAIKQKNDDIMYVTTETKLHKLVSTNCSEFTTCKSTMDGKNPLCGWCVLKNKATRHGECGTGLNEWLPAIEGNCPSLSPSPSGVHIGTGVSEVTIGAEHIPESPGDYQCVFVTPEKQYHTSARREGDNFTCSTPSDVKTHTKATLELKMSEVLLGRSSFIFCVCAQFKKCGDCVATSDIRCAWNNVTLACLLEKGGLIVSKEQCPHLSHLKGNTIVTPSGQETITVKGINLPSTYVYKCLVDTMCVDATLSGGNVHCSIKLQTDTNKTEKNISVKYGLPSSSDVDCSDMISIDEVDENRVIVYNLTGLAKEDCSICCALNKANDKFSWDNDVCGYNSNASRCLDVNCPPPNITKLEPTDGPTHGGTLLTLTGKNFGRWRNNSYTTFPVRHHITIGNQYCRKQRQRISTGYRYAVITEEYSTRKCLVTKKYFGRDDKQIVQLHVFDRYFSESNEVAFEFKTPEVTEIIPKKGPESGKTLITILGRNLGIGNKRLNITFNNNVFCTDVKLSYVLGENDNITCLTGKKESSEDKQTVFMYMDISQNPYEFDGLFEYVPDPIFWSIDPKKGTLSGGTILTVSGNNLDNVGAITIGSNKYKSMKVVCTRNSLGEARCPVPEASDILRKNIMESINSSRTNLTDGGCVEIPLSLYMDGITQPINISYCRDPELEKFYAEVLLYKSDDKHIKIKGEYLTLAAKEEDFKVTIGLIECPIIEVTATEIKCNPPEERPANPVVNVTVGNIHVTIGRLEYDKRLEKIAIIAIIAGTILGVILIIVIGVLFVCFKHKGGKQSKKYKNDPKNMEMEITDVAKQARQEQGTSGEAAGYSTFSTGLDEETKLLLQDQNLLIDRSILDKAELLGAGYFGSVYKGYLKYPDEKEDMLVAVKTLHQNSPGEIDVQAFLKEAVIMKDFNHPNVLNLIGICLALDDMPVVVLPYMKHGDLLTYIRNENNAPTIKDLMTFSIDIAEGMTYLSELKFVHRNLACRNCMLNEDFRVKVADFGLSRDIYETFYYASESQKTMLPVKWMALECLEEGKYSSKSDVWSFGIVLWELMTRGVNPYPGVDNKDIVRYLEHGNGRRMPQPQYCPDALYTIMRKCWHPSAKFRPKFSQLAHEIKEMISLLKQAMKQGEHTANIQSTYVNIDNCTAQTGSAFERSPGAEHPATPPAATPLAHTSIARDIRLFTMLEKVDQKQAKMEESLGQVLAYVRILAEGATADNTDMPEGLASVEELQTLEEQLAEESTHKALVNHLSFLGGKDLSDSCRRVMSYCITSDLAVQFNWNGLKEKREFGKLRLAAAVLNYHYTDEMMPTGSEVYDLDSAPTSPTSASPTGVAAGSALMLTGSEEYDTDSAPTSPTSVTTTVLAAGDADSSQPTNNHDTTNAKSAENASNDTGSSEAVNTNDNIDETTEDDMETEVRADTASD